MSENIKPPRPEVIVVQQRGHASKGFFIPFAIVLVAGLGLAIRSAAPDWRGLSQEIGRGWNRLAASWTSSPKEAPVALASAKKPVVDPVVPPKADAASPAPAVAEAPKKEKTLDAWDEIRIAAEKAKADQAEAERIKADADKQLAEAPLPPPVRRGRNFGNPADVAGFRRRQAAMMQEMQAQMNLQGLDFDRVFREQANAQRHFFEEFAKNRAGFRNLPPGFNGFAQPLLPGQPKVQEKSGEEVRDGVRIRWRTRVITMGPDGFGK